MMEYNQDDLIEYHLMDLIDRMNHNVTRKENVYLDKGSFFSIISSNFAMLQKEKKREKKCEG